MNISINQIVKSLFFTLFKLFQIFYSVYGSFYRKNLNLTDKVNYSKNGNESVIVNTKYSATGEKLQKENVTLIGINGSTTIKKITDYLDGFQYLLTITPPPSGGGGSESMMMANAETGRALERQAYSFDSDAPLTLLTFKTRISNFFQQQKVFTIIKKIIIFTSTKTTWETSG